MTITALRQISSDRVTVVLEDGSEIKSSLGVVTDRRLFAGKELSEEELALLRRDSSRSLARDLALELISRRRMSRKEVREKLLKKGAGEDAADYSVSWLSEHGFLNDGSYAAAVARHYAAKGYGAGARPLRAAAPRRRPRILGRGRGADARKRRQARPLPHRAPQGPGGP